MAARIRGAKTELEELGEWDESLAEGFSKYRAELKALTGVDIMIDDHTYKDLLTIFESIAQVWDQLDDTSQARVGEILGGTRNLSGVMSTINNIKDATNAYATAMDSAGVATEANSLYMDTAAAHMQQLKASFQELSADIMDSDGLKKLIDFGTSAINIIDTLTDNFGLLATAVAGVGIAKFVKEMRAMGQLSSLSDFATALGGSLTSFLNPVTIGVAAIAGFSAIYAQIEKRNEEIRQSAESAALEFSDNTASINEQIDRVRVLKESLASGTLSDSEALSAKAELLDIQNQLTASYGSYADSIDLVNGKLDDEIDKMRTLSAEDAKRFLNENGRGIEKALEEMEKPLSEYGIFGGFLDAGDEQSRSIDKILDKYKDYIKVTEDLNTGFKNLEFTGNAEDAHTVINEFMNDLRDARDSLSEGAQSNLLDGLISSSETLLTSADGILEKYQKIYDQAKQAELIRDKGLYTFGDSSDTAAEWLNDYTNAIKDYNEALAGGDTESIDVAKDNFEGLDAAIQDMTSSGGSMEKYSRQFTEVRSALNEAAAAQYNLEKDIEKLDVPMKVAAMSAEDFVNAWKIGDDADVTSVIDQMVELGHMAEVDEDSVRQLANALLGAADGASTAGLSISEMNSRLETFGEYQSTLVSAMSSSKSATGLTADEIKALSNAYEALNKDLDEGAEKIFKQEELFETTMNGVHLNEEALRALNEQVETNQLAELYQSLADKIYLKEQLQADGGNIEALEEEIAQTRQLISQYEGMTSAFNAWKNAQSAGNERDSYEAVGQGYENMKALVEQGWAGDDSLTAYLDLLLSAEQRTGDAYEDIEKLNQKIEGTSHSLMDYWNYDENDKLVTDGLYDFLDDVKSVFGESYVWQNEDGTYGFDFSGEKLKEVAERFGTTTEMVQLFERAMSDAGFAIQLQNMRLDDLNGELSTLKDNGLIDQSVSFEVDTTSLEDVQAKIEEISQVRDSIDVNADGADEAIAKLDRYIALLNSQAIQLKIDAQLEGGATVEELLGDENLAATLEIDDSQVDVARQKLEAMSNEQVDAAVVVRLDESQLEALTAPEKEGTVTYGYDDSAVQSYTPPHKDAWVYYHADTSNLINVLPPLTRTVNYVATGAVAGPKAAGTLGSARARGSVALGQDERALVNELGTESVIRDGQWMLIPGGMHQTNLKKGDIVLSAAQTKALIMTGAAPGHGRALAYGTFLSDAYDKGSGGRRRKSSGSSSSKSSSSKSSGGSGGSGGRSSGGGSNGGSNNSNSASNAEDELEIIDWIEVALDRIERTIDRLSIKATSSFNTLAKHLWATDKEIGEVNKEMKLQQQAYNRYVQQANKVGLAEPLAKLVRDGTIDIREYDKATAELIKDYQNWYEKALDCSDAIKQLREDLAELYENKFNDTKTDFENQLSLLEHLTNTYNNGIDYIDTRGYLATTKYYEAMRKVENQNLKLYQNELKDLVARMSDAVNSGAIKKFSESWYQMQQSINAVKESIQETQTEIVELGNKIRETLWERFDYLQTLISRVTDEADFLIKLMSYSDLFEDGGQLTNLGLSTMGLHGQNYNVYMNQADRYAQEIKKITADLAKDPNNTKLIEQREEWLKAQRESILNAEDEKKAIVDLVEEGIQKELEALKELINTYEDSLDSAKGLYEYQKKVNGQADEVAKLQKRLAAYQGDTSEENRVTLQKLNLELKEAMEDLQETQQDRAFSEQKKLLDEMYDEYEDVLNKRLDNVDQLILDMIDKINENSGTIGNTIEQEADDVGYTISETIRSIWANDGSANSVITQYGDGFLSSLTTVTDVLNGIAFNVAKMAGVSDTTANKTVSGEKKSTDATKKATKKKSASSTAKKTAASQKTGNGIVTPNLPTINDRLNVRNAPGTNGQVIRQLMNGNLVETDWKEQNGWLHIRVHNAKEDYWGWVSKALIKAYAKGARHIGHSGLAWTQEEGSEAIIRPSDNAILTKLKSGDSVLKASATDNLFEFGNNPMAFLAKLGINSANDMKRLASGAGLNAVDVGGISINIPIDHVSDYNDLVNQMRTDPRFEKLIQSMTVDRLVGGSKLSKTKYKW